MGPKIIICDVDGTVTEGLQPITREMTDAIASVSQPFAFLSGTDEKELQRIVGDPLDTRSKNYFLLGNSGIKVDLPNKEKVIKVLERTVDVFHLPCESDDWDQVLDRGSQVTLSCIGRNAPKEEKAEWDPDQRKRKIIAHYIRCSIGDKYNIAIGGTTSIDITAKGMDKAAGIRAFLTKLNLRPHQVVYYGDAFHPEGNDYSLLGVVPCVAVRNPAHFLEHLRDYVHQPG